MKGKETLTLIYYVNKTGKVKNLEISTKTLKIFIIAFVVIFLLFCIFLIYLTTNFYFKNYRLLEELRSAKELQGDFERRLREMEGAFLSYNIKQGKAGVDEEMNADAERVIAEENKIIVVESKVGLNNIRIEEDEDGKGLELHLEVVKKDGKEEKMSGFVVIVGTTGDMYFTLPTGIAVRDGFPVDYKRGEPFTIRNMKPFEEKIPYSIDSINALNIFVYSRDGKLLLKEGVNLR